MNTISNVNTSTFKLNGVNYTKNFIAVHSGDHVRIASAYDGRLSIASGNFSEFSVADVVYGNVEALMNALSPILFAKNTISSGGSEVSSSNTLLFHNDVSGVRHGTWAIPITGNLTADLTGAVEGGCVVVIWYGSSNPTISGAQIQSFSGEITVSGVYSIYMHHLNGRINVNIFNVDGSGGTTPGGIAAPTNLVLTQGDFTISGIAAPTNLVLTEGTFTGTIAAPTNLVLTEGTI